MTTPPPRPAIPEPGSLPQGYFERLWDGLRRGVDPWGLEGGWYEERKRACVLAALPAPRFRRAFEPGCANGALSALLAARCDELLCWEAADRPVGTARERLTRHRNLLVEQAVVPGRWPAGAFDLIVVSELAYYLDAPDRDALWAAVLDSLEPGGTLLAVHWVRDAPDYPTTGHVVHDELGDYTGLERTVTHTESDFRLDVFTRVPPAAVSVAERTGLR